jgi:hypothetical protein
MKCPNCQFINEIDTDLEFERARGIRNQTVDKWDNGTYYCLECGLTGPKNMIERLAAIFELLFRNKTLSSIINSNGIEDLISDAAKAEEVFDVDDLESFAKDHNKLKNIE